MTSSIWEKFSSRAWRAVSAVGRGGEGRQCKHHPIYVQREERFQFLWLFFFFFSAPTHAACVSSVLSLCCDPRDRTARFGTCETCEILRARWDVTVSTLQGKEPKLRPTVTGPLLRNPRFSLPPCKQPAGVRQSCISCTSLLNSVIILFFKRPVWQFGSNSRRRLEDHPTSK